MDLFLVLQMLFDAVLLFGILFLFHYSVHQSQKKKEEWDILKNAQVQEIKENLQELLMTLKQLGKEVSDNIQEQVREAEEKTEVFKKITAKLQRDLQKVSKLAAEIEAEKSHLEDKVKVIHRAKENLNSKSTTRSAPLRKPRTEGDAPTTEAVEGLALDKGEGGFGFSSGVVQEVYRLSDEKMNLGEIIQRTKLSRAEVQLILNLRGNGFTTPN